MSRSLLSLILQTCSLILLAGVFPSEALAVMKFFFLNIGPLAPLLFILIFTSIELWKVEQHGNISSYKSEQLAKAADSLGFLMTVLGMLIVLGLPNYFPNPQQALVQALSSTAIGFGYAWVYENLMSNRTRKNVSD